MNITEPFPFEPTYRFLYNNHKDVLDSDCAVHNEPATACDCQEQS